MKSKEKLPLNPAICDVIYTVFMQNHYGNHGNTSAYTEVCCTLKAKESDHIVTIFTVMSYKMPFSSRL